MPSCCVHGCKKESKTSNRQKDNVSFHMFPKKPVIRTIWMNVCGNHVEWTPKRTSSICSQHFDSTCFINKKRRSLKKDAIPTLKLPHAHSHQYSSGCKNDGCNASESSNCKCTSKTEVNGNETSLQSKDNESSSKIKKLKGVIQFKNSKIKILQSQRRYLLKKVDDLIEILKSGRPLDKHLLECEKTLDYLSDDSEEHIEDEFEEG